MKHPIPLLSPTACEACGTIELWWTRPGEGRQARPIYCRDCRKVTVHRAGTAGPATSTINAPLEGPKMGQ